MWCSSKPQSVTAQKLDSAAFLRVLWWHKLGEDAIDIGLYNDLWGFEMLGCQCESFVVPEFYFLYSFFLLLQIYARYPDTFTQKHNFFYKLWSGPCTLLKSAPILWGGYANTKAFSKTNNHLEGIGGTCNANCVFSSHMANFTYKDW